MQPRPLHLTHQRSMKALLLLFFAVVPQISIAAGPNFVGHWRSDDPCVANGFGSHNSMTLERVASNIYVGSWEESTNGRGWAGQIKGYEQNGTLVLSRCIDPESSSWNVSEQDSWPNFKEIGSYKLSGKKLVRQSNQNEWLTAYEFFQARPPHGKLLEELYNCPNK